MNQFYVSIMFIGILLMLISFIWVIIDKKRHIDYREVIDEKKTSLVNIVEDAEVMVEELNKFSGYVFDEFEVREKNVKGLLNKLDQEIKEKTVVVNSMKITEKAEEISFKKAVGENRISPKITYVQNNSGRDKDLNGIIEQREEISRENNYETEPKKDNVIHLKQRYKKVLNMVDDGLTQGEIAKKLNMGKSEVQLILEMYR